MTNKEILKKLRNGEYKIRVRNVCNCNFTDLTGADEYSEHNCHRYVELVVGRTVLATYNCEYGVDVIDDDEIREAIDDDADIMSEIYSHQYHLNDLHVKKFRKYLKKKANELKKQGYALYAGNYAKRGQVNDCVIVVSPECHDNIHHIAGDCGVDYLRKISPNELSEIYVNNVIYDNYAQYSDASNTYDYVGYIFVDDTVHPVEYMCQYNYYYK
jgi:hypothetical protein